MTTKTQLRQAMKDQRNRLDPDTRADYATRICRRLLALDEITHAQTLFTYISIGSEVDTHLIINRLLETNKTVLAPAGMNRGIMKARQLAGLDSLSTGILGIPEPPDTGEAYAGDIDVILLPALAFTIRGDRLGQAGGYYDRFIAENPQPIRIGLAFDIQIINHIPTQPHDQPVQLIVTESRTIKCR